MEKRQALSSHERAFILTLVLSLGATVYCALELLRIPADTKNAFLFGLSKERLLMIGCFGLLFLLLTLLLVFRKKAQTWLENHQILRNPFICCSVVSLFLVLMPEYRFGRKAAIYTRILPFLLWIFLVTTLFSLYLSFIHNSFNGIKETGKNLLQYKKNILITLAFLLAGVIFVETTGLGKTVESALWNKNGIPLQSIQLFICLVVFLFALKTGIAGKLDKSNRILNFFIIWAVSAFIWSLAPEINHFFAPGPYEPNNTFYPYSDAAGYDLSAQTALNGWGFNFGYTMLKPTVVFISFLSRLITGNDTSHAMLFQSAFYAVLPAIIYLLGTDIGGTWCGYLAAAFSICKEWNALRSQSVLTINSRLVMSEFLTQIFLALFCYAVFHWLKKNGREILYAILAGGALCLGIFTRYNFFAFLPAVLLILVIGYWGELRKLLKPLLFFTLTILLTAAPIVYREQKLPWNMFSEFSRTINDVLIRQRFQGQPPFGSEEYEPISILSVSDDKTASVTIREYSNLSKKASTIPMVSKTASVREKTTEFLKVENIEFNTGQITQNISNINSTINLPVFPSMINHGLHNFIASVMTLPMEWTFQDLEHLYTQEGDGLWKDTWQGNFSPRQWISIGVWIILGAVSIGVLLHMHGIAGASILYFWLVYCFSIGFSRSSGGRYVVPVNWIPMLLLAFGIVSISSKGKISLSSEAGQSLHVWQPVLALVCFTAFFGSMVLFENFLPARDTSAPEGDLLVLKERLSENTDISIDWDLVETQQKEGVLHITHGMAIYPRFYYFRTGEHTESGVLMGKDYSRMVFFGLNRQNNSRVYREYLMPHKELIGYFPQDSIYRAISCTSDFGYEDVLAVIIETPDGQNFTYIRDPLPEFSCPVPEPVCITIENCY